MPVFPIPPDPTRLDVLKGFNNVSDPMRDGWEFQSTADNVNGTDSGGMERREGYTSFLSATSITGSYASKNFSRLYIIDAGALKSVHADGTATTIATGLSGTACWTEVNDVVYLSCGTSKLQIEQDDAVRQWGVPVPVAPNAVAASGSLFPGVYQACITYTDSYGREGGPSVPTELAVTSGGFTLNDIPVLAGYATQVYATEADGAVFYHVASLPTQSACTVATQNFGRELLLAVLDAPPLNGRHLCVFGSRIYMAEYMPEADQTIVWFSQPLGYHLFDMSADFLIVPGEVTQLAASSDVMSISTQTRVYLYDGEKLVQAAEYGAVPGQHASVGADGKIYLWTKRGLCRAAPFENMTEARVSVAPGIKAGGTIMERNGYRKFVVVTNQGGDRFNARN